RHRQLFCLLISNKAIIRLSGTMCISLESSRSHALRGNAVRTRPALYKRGRNAGFIIRCDRQVMEVPMNDS
ncbi:hypothetical protein QUF80_05895, partial [Desulfococcaceae bacterium HSG8]|nr:hypothetical protein [Desulfococcaceae bacterium HSG8]